MGAAGTLAKAAAVPKALAPAPAPAGAARVPSPPIATTSVVGNQAVLRLLAGRTVQAKRAVSQPNDPDEREADQVAETLASPSGKCGCVGGQACQCPGPLIHRKAKVHTPARARETASLPALHGGRPLAARDRSFFEDVFGRDLSAVRVYNDAGADTAARSIGARAFTTGHDVVFGAGEYAPSGTEGRRLLAHELTHVVQQEDARDASAPVQRAPLDPQNEKAWSYLEKRLDRDSQTFLDTLSATPEKALQVEKSLQKEGEPKTAEERERLVARIEKLIQLNAVGLMASHRATVSARQEELWNAPKREDEEEGGKPAAPTKDPVALNAAALRTAAGQVLLLQTMKEKLDDSRRALKLLSGQMTRVGGGDFIEVFSALDRNSQFLRSDAIRDYFRQAALGLASAGQISKGALTGLTFNMGHYLSAWRERQIQGVDVALVYLYQAFPIFGQMGTMDFADTVLEKEDRRVISRAQMAYVELLKNIDVGIARIGSGKIPPFDLTEAVRQTSDSLPPDLQKVLKDEIKGRQKTKFWVEMGITIGQAALVFVPVVGPFLAAGVGLAQLGMQVDEALNRESLAAASTSPDRQMLGVSGPTRLEWVLLAVQAALTVADVGAAVKSLRGRPHVSTEGGPRPRAAEEPHGVPGKGEPARPPARPGVAEGGVVPQPGASRFSASERAALEETRHVQGPLQPRQLETELDLATRSPKQPSSVAGYAEEVTLTNGHTWRRTPEGRWCRFSNGGYCVTVGGSPTSKTRVDWYERRLQGPEPAEAVAAKRKLAALVEESFPEGTQVTVKQIERTAAGRAQSAAVTPAGSPIAMEHEFLIKLKDGTRFNADGIRPVGGRGNYVVQEHKEVLAIWERSHFSRRHAVSEIDDMLYRHAKIAEALGPRCSGFAYTTNSTELANLLAERISALRRGLPSARKLIAPSL